MLPLDDPQLLEIFGRASFWADYYWNDGWAGDPLWDSAAENEEDTPGAVYPILDSPIVLGLSGAYDLLLTLSSRLGYTDLSLKAPALPEPLQIAWDDAAHFMPHVFRWDELRAICACLSRRHSSVPSAIPALLLCRFTPVTPDDDQQQVRQFLRSSWESLGLFSSAHVESFIDCTACFVEEFRWEADAARGWVLDAVHAYSLRRSNNSAFPFAELNRLFDVVGRCAAGGA